MQPAHHLHSSPAVSTGPSMPQVLLASRARHRSPCTTTAIAALGGASPAVRLKLRPALDIASTKPCGHIDGLLAGAAAAAMEA